MKYNELNVSKQRLSKRVGRGISAGGGKTAGRGTKGQGSRKSPGKAGFEGGQMPIYMRLPKLRGFKQFRSAQEVVYTAQLNEVKGTLVSNQTVADAGFVSSPFVSVKLIVNGQLASKKTVTLQGASSSAVKMLEASGGTFETVERVGRLSKKDLRS